VRFAIPFVDDDPESAIPVGFETADMVKPSPTSWAVLEVDSADGEPSLPGVGRSDDQYLTRCKELSKLLRTH
jgi:hypothetical protein